MTNLALPTRSVGLALLFGGWAVLILAPTLLDLPALRYLFVIAGILVELLGLAMVGIYHRDASRSRR